VSGDLRPLLPAGIAILGPTGSGKSALAMQIAARLPVEIISVDSAQVYRGLDIGTAKPTLADRRAVIHHLIDIREPERGYSAGEFRNDALRLIGEIAARGRVPLLVGGTMLYFKALFRGIADLPAADAALRSHIDARATQHGWPALHAELAARDPVAAASIHPNDAQRIQRALELSLLSGRSRHQLWAQESNARFDAWRIAVLLPGDREQLHTRLAARLDEMLAAGFVAELQALLARGCMSEDSHTLRLVGYRQLLEHVRGRESLDAAAAKMLAATRQLAKRQLTWLRSDKLLPNGASEFRFDPFDAALLPVFVEALIKDMNAP
jgi:tRNA dimethylallyltransferase